MELFKSEKYKKLNQAWFVVLVIMSVELLSYNVSGAALVMNLAFGVIFGFFVFAALTNYKLALAIALVELLISSKGYLFSLTIDSYVVSIRIAFWFVLLSVWFGGLVANSSKLVFYKRNLREILNENFVFFKSKYFLGVSILFFVVLWGVINGIYRGNVPSFLFNDFNAWLYLLIIFPVYDTIRNKEDLMMIFKVSLLAVFWMSVKSLLILYLYSHFSPESLLGVYRWVRDSGVGEITYNSDGLYRVFFQSHIYCLLLYVVLLVKYVFDSDSEHKHKAQNLFKKNIVVFLAAIFLAVTVVSQSRSNWLGLGCGVVLTLVFAVFLKRLSGLKRVLSFIVLTSIMSVFFIIATVNFPLPLSSDSISTGEALAKRVSTSSNESAVSSRWALLPVLFKQNMQAPIMGKGFGAELTYNSSDPRLINSPSKGLYTTYAFEWGWLDLWLKLGLAGVAVFAYIFFLLANDLVGALSEKRTWLPIALLLGFITLCAVNMFSPYINHPLGLGFLVYLLLSMDIHRSTNVG